MTRRVRGMVAGLAAVIALAFWVGAGRGGDKNAWKEFIPEDAYKELVAREAKIIQEGLKAGDEDQLKRARVGAIMIMGYAVSHQKNNTTAVQISIAQELGKAIRARGKLDEARKLADMLARGEMYKAKDAAPDWRGGDLTVVELMDPLRVQKKGGDGIASELQLNIRLKGALNGIEESVRYVAGKKLSDANMDKASKELALLSYRMAVLGEIVHEYPPTKKKGTPKEWKELSLDMRNAAIDLAAAAQKKDAEVVFKAAGRLNSSCNQCHSSFR